MKEKSHETWVELYQQQKETIRILQSEVWDLKRDYSQKQAEVNTIRDILGNVNKLLELKVKNG